MTGFLRPCLGINGHGCAQLTRDTRCPEHQRAYGRQHNASRPPADGVYNSAAWRRLAREAVAAEPWCHWCGRRGVRLSADHVVAIRQGGAPLDSRNVTVACYRCQNLRRGRAAAGLRS